MEAVGDDRRRCLVFSRETPNIMRRQITIAGLALLAVAFARPAAAQQYAGEIAEDYAKEGKEQVARAKKYTAAANSKAYMSAPRSSLNYGGADASGRFDMSGHAPPSYFQLRNQSTNFATRAYSSAASRRRVPRSNYYSKAAPAARPSASTGGRSASGTIPPAPR
ncbi:MAG: hypothetical protein BGO49_02320 [Planctomycetales bacterium 71-10]|nr:MAG: hypothetical protein BGO49_02320 [Planctomycetales bacterium 71-10]